MGLTTNFLLNYRGFVYLISMAPSARKNLLLIVYLISFSYLSRQSSKFQEQHLFNKLNDDLLHGCFFVYNIVYTFSHMFIKFFRDIFKSLCMSCIWIPP